MKDELIILLAFVGGIALILLIVGLFETFRPRRPEDEGKYWIKILAFIFLTPIWLILVLTDRTERLSVKIFATVWVGLAIISIFVALSNLFASETVTLIANGTGSGLIGYGNENNEIIQETVQFPWSKTLRLKSGQIAGLIVNTDYDPGFTTCEVWLGNRMITSNVSNNYVMPAYCKAQVP